MNGNGLSTLPNGWQWRQFGECAQLINGRAYSQDELLDTGTPVLRIQNLNGGDRWYYSNLTLPEDKYCQEGDLLFAWSASFGPYRFAGPRSIFHYHIWRVIPKAGLDKTFAFRLLEWITEKVKSAAHGVAMLHMTKAGMEAWPVPVPPPSEQRRVAEILDQADALRAKRRSTLAQLGILTQSVFLDLFGDPVLPERSVGELLECGALLLHKDGNHGSMYPKADDFGGTGVPFLSAKAVTEDGQIVNELVENLKEEKASKLSVGWIRRGDVLLAHNASVGKVAQYDGRFEKALIGTSLTAFRPNPGVLDSCYLAAALRSTRFQRQLEKNMGQTTRNQVPITAQRRLRIGLPEIKLQREYTRRVESLEQVKETHRRSSLQLEALFISLQARAFRGEL